MLLRRGNEWGFFTVTSHRRFHPAAKSLGTSSFRISREDHPLKTLQFPGISPAWQETQSFANKKPGHQRRGHQHGSAIGSVLSWFFLEATWTCWDENRKITALFNLCSRYKPWYPHYTISLLYHLYPPKNPDSILKLVGKIIHHHLYQLYLSENPI